MQRFNIDYSTFYSGIAIGFAEYLRDSGSSVQLKLAQFVGGTASGYLRKEFRDVLKTEIHEVYSSKEGGSMASPCPLGHGWHQNAESVLLEIVDAHGHPVEAGQTGRVVITPFGSSATPLIRYDQGDLAVAGPSEICPCGRTLPCIAAFSGRLRHDFRRPNGDQVDELSIDARRQLGAGTWQIARVAEHSFEVRYKKRDWGIPPNIEEFSKLFRQDYYPEAEVKTIIVDEFQLGPTGKHMERVDEWDPDSQVAI
jgi:phenylacetate-CoA ligase